tara:strand:- start:1773 stop:2297 length:525 start_codon:yes stop_codon:yes gene_type:complete
MKKIITFLLFFFYINPVLADKNIVYLDIQYIIDNSNLGKFYKTKIKIKQDNNNEILQSEQKKLKEKEQEINNQKNILKKEELNKQFVEFNNLVVKYKELRKELNNSIVKEKKNYSAEILRILNPLLTNYVENNNIHLVVDKKNILVGIKSLDITTTLLDILNKETKERKLINEN